MLKIRDDEEKNRLIAENSTDVIWTMDLSGRFTYVSPAVTLLAGYTPEEAMAIPLDRYLHREDVSWVLQELYEEMRKPRGERLQGRMVECRQYKKDGSVLDIEVTVSWLYDERGEIVLKVDPGVKTVMSPPVPVPEHLDEGLHVRIFFDMAEKIQKKKTDRIVGDADQGILICDQGADEGEIDQGRNKP